jgi:hypothetical protein
MKQLVTLVAAAVLAVSPVFADDQAPAAGKSDVLQSLDGAKQVADASSPTDATAPAATSDDSAKAKKHHAKKHKKHHHKKAKAETKATDAPASSEAPAATPAQN